MASLQVRQLPVGQMQANCYLVWDKEKGEGIIIDPGDDTDYITRVVADEGFIPQMIVATHGHFDHILAVQELRLAYTIPFFIHKNDEFLVQRMRQSANHFLGVDAGPAPKIDGYLDKPSFEIGTLIIRIIEVPGHTPGSVTLYSKDDALAFVGDLLFAGGGVGRTDFSYSSEIDLRKSIKKILALPENTTIYSGHGEATTIGREKKFLG